MIGIIMVYMLEVLANPADPEFRHKANILAMWMLLCGAIAVCILFFKRGIQVSVAERITTSLRVDVFQKLLRMHIGFFDDPAHSAGALAGRLAADATQVNTLITNAANLVMVGVGGLLTGIIMAFVGSWQLALVGVGLLPFLLIGGKVQADVNKRMSSLQDDAYVDANGFLAEMLNNMRTVASFAQEDETYRLYNV